MTRKVALIANRGGQRYVYLLSNMESYSNDLDIPVQTMAVPESESTEAHNIKITGNIAIVTIAWQVIDSAEDTSDASHAGYTITPGVIQNAYSADEQAKYLRGKFESTSLSDGDDLLVIPRKESRSFGGKRVFDVETLETVRGRISKIILSQSSDSPLTYSATMTINVGNTLTAVKDTP